MNGIYEVMLSVSLNYSVTWFNDFISQNLTTLSIIAIILPFVLVFVVRQVYRILSNGESITRPPTSGSQSVGGDTIHAQKINDSAGFLPENADTAACVANYDALKIIMQNNKESSDENSKESSDVV
ncbi:MAG: hypothetical protein FWB92_10990 [Oscillospiraceae bacterium]|nr:hypothetical protein [Oscillospiraceae bacterium]